MEIPQEISTERLTLRRLERSDQTVFTEVVLGESQRLEKSFAGTLRTLKSHPEEYFEQCDLGWRERTRFRYGVWSADTFAGLVGLRSVDWENRSGELFYFLRGGFEGQGLAFEATRSLLDQACCWGLGQFWLRVLPANDRSSALAERLGFDPAEILSKNYTTLDGTVHDTQVYRLKKSDDNELQGYVAPRRP